MKIDVPGSVRRRLAGRRAIAAASFAATAWATTPALASDAAIGRCNATVRPVATVVTLHVADRAGLSRDTAEAMMDEASALWRPAGVVVRWAREGARQSGPRLDGDAAVSTHASSPLRGIPVDGHVSLTLVMAPKGSDDDAAAGTRVRRLAAILFVDGAPTTVMTAYPGAVERLVAEYRGDAWGAPERPRLLRDRLEGRVLGRAVAHELGHFLFGSAGHSASGLMRPSHRAAALVSPSRRPFQVLPPPADCDVVFTMARDSVRAPAPRRPAAAYLQK